MSKQPTKKQIGARKGFVYAGGATAALMIYGVLKDKLPAREAAGTLLVMGLPIVLVVGLVGMGIGYAATTND